MPPHVAAGAIPREIVTDELGPKVAKLAPSSFHHNSWAAAGTDESKTPVRTKRTASKRFPREDDIVALIRASSARLPLLAGADTSVRARRPFVGLCCT